MSGLRGFFEGTTRDILFTCPACSSSSEIPDQPLDTRTLEADGFELVDGAWTGLCETCKAERGDADNAEYDAIVRAAVELVGVANVGPLRSIEVPAAEGFSCGGETHFGFWTASGDFTDAGFERFARMASGILDDINRDRGTALLVNFNADRTQAIVHGLTR